MTASGAKYNFTCPGAVGVANAADSLEGFKKAGVSMIRTAQCGQALSVNYCAKTLKARKSIRQMLINEAPKYGNDIPEVDLLARKAVDVHSWMNWINTKMHVAGALQPGLTAITANISFRKAGGSAAGRTQGAHGIWLERVPRLWSGQRPERPDSQHEICRAGGPYEADERELSITRNSAFSVIDSDAGLD